MKRTILTLAFAAMIIALKAQSGSTIVQPGEFTARRINASGEVTKEYNASFTYGPDGKLDRFYLPERDMRITFDYENNFITWISGRRYTYRWGIRYTYYEDGKLKMKNKWDVYENQKITTYTYNEIGRMDTVYYYEGVVIDPDHDPYDACSIFEYENGGKTRVEFYYTSRLSRISTRQYNDDYAIASEQTDKYNSNGEITQSTRTLYTYNTNGDPGTVVSQTLTDGDWVNNSTHNYIYDDNQRVVEQQDGIWSQEFNDWIINRKTIHEYSDDNTLYTVSFYKKNGDDWIWDVYGVQTLFFDSELNMQTISIGYLSQYAEGDGYGPSANINQFEFHMIQTERPTYMKVGEDSAPACAVYPNPGNGQVRIEASVEDCVVRFYDLNGRLVLAKPFDFATDVATDNWTPGLYLWEIWNGAQRQASGKWVKE